jgi:hypothetical protein
MFYYNKDGSPSSCFVKFSTGGIHGAEYNKELYEHDLKCYETAVKEATDEWLAAKERFKIAKETYPDPRDLKIAKGIVIDGKKYTPSHFLKPKATKDHAEYKDVPAEPKLLPRLFRILQTKDLQLPDHAGRIRFCAEPTASLCQPRSV